MEGGWRAAASRVVRSTGACGVEAVNLHIVLRSEWRSLTLHVLTRHLDLRSDTYERLAGDTYRMRVEADRPVDVGEEGV